METWQKEKLYLEKHKLREEYEFHSAEPGWEERKETFIGKTREEIREHISEDAAKSYDEFAIELESLNKRGEKCFLPTKYQVWDLWDIQQLWLADLRFESNHRDDKNDIDWSFYIKSKDLWEHGGWGACNEYHDEYIPYVRICVDPGPGKIKVYTLGSDTGFSKISMVSTWVDDNLVAMCGEDETYGKGKPDLMIQARYKKCEYLCLYGQIDHVDCYLYTEDEWWDMIGNE